MYVQSGTPALCFSTKLMMTGLIVSCVIKLIDDYAGDTATFNALGAAASCAEVAAEARLCTMKPIMAIITIAPSPMPAHAHTERCGPDDVDVRPVMGLAAYGLQ